MIRTCVLNPCERVHQTTNTDDDLVQSEIGQRWRSPKLTDAAVVHNEKGHTSLIIRDPSSRWESDDVCLFDVRCERGFHLDSKLHKDMLRFDTKGQRYLQVECVLLFCP